MNPNQSRNKRFGTGARRWVCGGLLLFAGRPFVEAAPQIERFAASSGALQFAWAGTTGVTYRLDRSPDLLSWSNLYSGIIGTGVVVRSTSPVAGHGFYRVSATALPTGWVEVIQLLDDFAWPSDADPTGQEERGYRYYGRLGSDRGDMGAGLQAHSLTVTNGTLVAVATSGPQGTSWVGRWHSTSHTALETAEVLNFAAPFSPLIRENWQPRVNALYVRLKGSGTIKMELKGSANNLLASWTSAGTWGPGFQEVRFPIAYPAAYPAVKLVNLVVESPSALEFDEIGMKLSVPRWLHEDVLRYAFAASHASLYRGYDAASGNTRDHIHWPAGHFDSMPAAGFQALGAALAYDMGLMAYEAATQIVARSVAALVAAPRHRGLLPHWMEHGVPKDWSTVDTGLALISSRLACQILGLAAELAAVQNLIDAIEWDPLINAQGQVAHGYTADLSTSPYFWVNWDGEGAVVQMLRLLQDPSAPLFTMDPAAPIYGGRGFIVEIAGLLAPAFAGLDGVDRYGVDWGARRRDMLAAQKAYYPANHPASLAATLGLYGLSSIEVINALANTAYLAAGIGTPTVPAEDGGGWICPHYAVMAGSLDGPGLETFLVRLRELGVLQPLIGVPEGVKAGHAGTTPERWHSAQITLNTFFHVAGLYHTIRARDGGADVVYEAVRTDPRWRAALEVLFP
ncbi:MAG: hypothetical protein KA248_01980 [Kiritimatiellae bacterium]|nr:hypothetical protein [Kiritimatiellia bacterium]